MLTLPAVQALEADAVVERERIVRLNLYESGDEGVGALIRNPVYLARRG